MPKNMMKYLRRCTKCQALWIEGCLSSERAFWCEECKRPEDHTTPGNWLGPYDYSKPALQSKDKKTLW